MEARFHPRDQQVHRNRYRDVKLKFHMKDKDRQMKKKVLGTAMLLAVIAVSACETVQGARRDLQTAGQVVQQEGAQAQYGM